MLLFIAILLCWGDYILAIDKSQVYLYNATRRSTTGIQDKKNNQQGGGSARISGVV